MLGHGLSCDSLRVQEEYVGDQHALQVRKNVSIKTIYLWREGCELNEMS